MTKEQIEAKVAELAPWYHSIELPHGIRTPGKFETPIWPMVRKVRGGIDYKGKQVLDTASFEGMWAFEAEDLGASLVVATDVQWTALERFLFCREARGSNVMPFYNVPLHDIVRRLDSFWAGRHMIWEAGCKSAGSYPLFDIVHHLGVLYHIVEPLNSFLQLRSLMPVGGILLLETAAYMTDQPAMLLNRDTKGKTTFYAVDGSTWWAPSISCLLGMLSASGFEPDESSIQQWGVPPVNRVCLRAKAVPVTGEATCTYRQRGIDIGPTAITKHLWP